MHILVIDASRSVDTSCHLRRHSDYLMPEKAGLEAEWRVPNTASDSL